MLATNLFKTSSFWWCFFHGKERNVDNGMGRIGETIKVVPVNNSELYMISGEHRYCIAKANGRV